MDDELLADLEAVEDERQEPLPSEQIDEVLAGEEGELSQQSPVVEANPEERASSATDLGKRRPEQADANVPPCALLCVRCDCISVTCISLHR